MRLHGYSHCMRAILAGGGTGGHVIPALAIAQELKERYEAEVLFIGTARGIENRLVPAAGFPLRLVEVGALNKVSLKTRLKTLFALPMAVWEARRILQDFGPQVVIGVGGYASGPAMLAAVLGRVPTLAFEPNVVPGFANRIVARWVSAAAVHFEETGKFFRTRRKSQASRFDKRFSRLRRNPTEGKDLLVFGGSQGAKAINQAVIQALPELLKQVPAIHIVHQTGERDFPGRPGGLFHIRASCRSVSIYRRHAGVLFSRRFVLCRSGASTVAEITAAGKPAVFVPFPHAADDHQKRNAQALEQAGAAVMLEETKLTAKVW